MFQDTSEGLEALVARHEEGGLPSAIETISDARTSNELSKDILKLYLCTTANISQLVSDEDDLTYQSNLSRQNVKPKIHLKTLGIIRLSKQSSYWPEPLMLLSARSRFQSSETHSGKMIGLRF